MAVISKAIRMASAPCTCLRMLARQDCCHKLPMPGRLAFLTRRASSLLDSDERLHAAIRAARHRRWLATRGAGQALGSNGGVVAAAAAGAFLTLAEPHSSELEVKKSKFITHAWPCSTADEAQQLIAGRRDTSASHNCWAYKVGQQYRSSDDGEPSGTAGRPILAAIEGEGLDGVAVLVIRFYGGIKLGAGGLVRAYGGAARECLRAAAKQQMTPKVELRLQVPFELLGPIYPLLEQHSARKQEESYQETAVSLVVSLEAGRAEALRLAIADATSGRVVAELLTE